MVRSSRDTRVHDRGGIPKICMPPSRAAIMKLSRHTGTGSGATLQGELKAQEQVHCFLFSIRSAALTEFV